MKITTLERFETKFIKRDTGCWEWKDLEDDGCGRFSFNGKIRMAHRVSFILYKGEIENKLKVLRSCHNLSCVNPEHLFLGTQFDVMQRAAQRGNLKRSDEFRKAISKANYRNIEHKRNLNTLKSKDGYFRKGTYVRCKSGDKLLLGKVDGGEWIKTDTGQSFQLKLKGLDILVQGIDFEKISKEELKKVRSREYKQYLIDNYDKVKLSRVKRNLLKTFGLSYEQFIEIRDSQNNVCKICKRSEQRRNLNIDHCHLTGKIRGLLCSNCNTALGLFQDNIESLQSAIEYLKVTQI